MFKKQPPITGTGKQLSLTTQQIQTNPLNPRRLFDEAPMLELKESISDHGILVPLTVYLPSSGNRYLILDGERRYRCCVELENEGHSALQIPCNAVVPPDRVANIIYMFAIHKFRLDWELMPTAISLQQLLSELTEAPSDKELRTITGLSQAQIERCRILMLFPPDLQQLSLDQNPSTRIPANFWFEMYAVLEMAEKYLPSTVAEYGDKFDVARRFTEKYRRGSIKSVIDFRRIKRAFAQEAGPLLPKAVDRLDIAIRNLDAKLTELFGELSSTATAVANLTDAISNLRSQLDRVAPDLVEDVEALRHEFEDLYKRLGTYIDQLPQLPPSSE